MRLRILTWHIHGSYLYYLTQAPHEFYLPTKPDQSEGYGGKLRGMEWGDNVHDIPANQVREQEFDCILFQSRRNYLQDQFEILSEKQRQLPKIYLEHDPPREHPTDTQHVVDDPNVLLVHVTHFNQLVWNNNQTSTCVIEHGVKVPDLRYTGSIPKGIVVANGLRTRGRRMGADIFQQVRQLIPLDLVGMDSRSLGGLGEVAHDQLPMFQARYRFFFHPARYTSLGLAVCEAMMVGLPIVGLATTELVSVIDNGVSGYIETNLSHLILGMQELLKNPEKARQMGDAAREQARSRFNIQRFIEDWNQAFEQVMDNQVSLSEAKTIGSVLFSYLPPAG
jgi:glycosyltransferase involved in cell wall biosynthesis